MYTIFSSDYVELSIIQNQVLLEDKIGTLFTGTNDDVEVLGAVLIEHFMRDVEPRNN